jgi:hypothetical protein
MYMKNTARILCILLITVISAMASDLVVAEDGEWYVIQNLNSHSSITFDYTYTDKESGKSITLNRTLGPRRQFQSVQRKYYTKPQVSHIEYTD